MKTRRNAFTLLELMVVLGISAIMASLLFGVINNIRNGNRRTQCVSNLSQIYGALRLYAQDYDGKFPYANPSGLSSSPTSSRGLWLLWKYPSGLNAGYLKSPAVFTCPQDQTSTLTPLTPFTYSMSYQWLDDRSPAPAATYSVFRQSASKRQLQYFIATASPPNRIADATTVVTWCRWHRSLNAVTGATLNDDGKDNILFLDGRIQSVPVFQPVNGASDLCSGWKRLPIEDATSNTDASICSP